MLSPAGLEEASHKEFYRSKELNSACSHVNLEEDPKPQMRSQPSRQLDFSFGDCCTSFCSSGSTYETLSEGPSCACTVSS